MYGNYNISLYIFNKKGGNWWVMKKLKIVSVILVGVMLLVCFGLMGCQQEDAASTEGNDADSEPKTKLVVGTSASYFPWAYQEGDEVKGFEVDVWNEIAERNNFEIEWKLSKFSGLIGMLDAGQIDTVAHQMSITDERLEKYDFTEPYAYSYYDFAIKTDSELKTLEDLKGKKVGCWLGGNGEKSLKDINEAEGLNLDIVTYDGSPIETEVDLGRLDASWQGEIKTVSTIKEGNLDLKMMGLKPFYEVNAYPFLKGDEGKKTADQISVIIKEMREDGTLAELSNKWFGLDTTVEPEPSN